MKKILITGGSGFIGKYLIKQLKPHYDIFSLNKNISKNTQGCRTIIHDFSEDSNLIEYPNKINTVIHMASTRNYKRKNSEKEIFNVNVASTMKLLEEAYLNNTKHFIYISTGGVYPLSNYKINENHKILNFKKDKENPMNFYFKTKIMAEEIVNSYSQKMKTTIIRPFFPFGIGQNKIFLIPRLISNIREKRTIEMNKKNSFRFNPIFISDLINVLEILIKKELSGLFNLCGDNVISINELITLISKFFNIKPELKNINVDGINQLVGDNSSIKKKTGIKFLNFYQCFNHYLENLK